MITEEWRDIAGYEGLYQVSNTGKVRSLCATNSRRKRELKLELKNGYLAIHLYKDHKFKHFYVHRLVAKTFIANPNNYSEVNHIDCNKCNNQISNLEWCDRRRNLKHSYDNGLKRTGEKHGCHKLTSQDVINIRLEYVKNDPQHSLNTLAKKYSVTQSTIHAIVTRRLWKEEVMPNVCEINAASTRSV